MSELAKIVKLLVDWRLRNWPSRPAVRLPHWCRADLRGTVRWLEVTGRRPGRLDATAVVELEDGAVEAMLVTLVRRQSGWWVQDLTLLSERVARQMPMEDVA